MSSGIYRQVREILGVDPPVIATPVIVRRVEFVLHRSEYEVGLHHLST
jgi:hypothetical protein